jgi:RNA polymerase sigma-70 factor (ECF subfamily)
MNPEPRDFAGWYGREHDPLVRAVLVMTGDPELAADVVAEAFSRAYERWAKVGLIDNPSGWVYRVAVNLLRRRWRRQRFERALLRRGPGSVDRVESDPAPEIWVAVGLLPSRQREAIALRYVVDLSERQVAEAMGVAEGTASATLAAARRRLARDLDQLEEVRWT